MLFKKFSLAKGVLFICFLLSLAVRVVAQTLPLLQPEQDACNALRLCGNRFTTPYSYAGSGHLSEIDISEGCFSESNSVWFRLRVAIAGNMVFAIQPINAADDYDFAVYDITGSACDSPFSGKMVRCSGNCNGNCNQGQPLYPGGIIGLNYASELITVPPSTAGSPFLKYLEIKQYDEFLILVDNFSRSAAGFSIDFNGSTAIFDGSDVQPQSADTLVAHCATQYSTLVLRLREPVSCSSILADGSNFTLSDTSARVMAAVGANCSGPLGYTREIQLTLNGKLEPDAYYTLTTKAGSDGTSLGTICGQAYQPFTKGFETLPPVRLRIGNDTALCLGGSVALNAIQLGQGDVRIRWQPATYLSSNTISNPIASPPVDMEYVVLAAPVGYPSTCYHRDTIKIKVLKGFEMITPDTMLCRPEEIRIQLQGDSAFTYTWSPFDYLSGTTGMFQNAVPEKSVTYAVKASYPGCKDSLETITIRVAEWPNLITRDTLICKGQLVPIQVAGNGNFSHVWSPALYLSDAALINPIAAPDSTIVYTLVASNSGCQDSVQSLSMAVEPLPAIALIQSNTLCAGSTLQLLPIVSPANNNYIYKWEPAVLFNNANSSRAIYAATTSTTVRLIVSTPNGCADTATQLLNVSPLPVANAGEDMAVIAGQGFTLQGTVDQTSATIKWTPGLHLSSDNILNPRTTLSASQNFVLSVSNEFGCAAKDTVFITVLKDIHIPNAFSPNGDGVNDVWNIPGLSSYQNGKTQVFNRWGQMVFESKGYEKPWDGKFKGSQLPIGVYYYLINMNENGYNTLKGSVTLIR